MQGSKYIFHFSSRVGCQWIWPFGALRGQFIRETNGGDLWGEGKVVELVCLVGGGDLERRIIFTSDPHFWEVFFSPQMGGGEGEGGLRERKWASMRNYPSTPYPPPPSFMLIYLFFFFFFFFFLSLNIQFFSPSCKLVLIFFVFCFWLM